MKKNIFKVVSIAMIISTMMGNNVFAFSSDQAMVDSLTPISSTYTSNKGWSSTSYAISGHKENASVGWHRIKGNYYYFNDSENPEPMKNTTTPDGYTVDDQGSWTVNGAIQDDGYGSFFMDTDNIYAGKSDEDIWTTMRDQAVEVGKEVKTCRGKFSVTYDGTGVEYGVEDGDFYLYLAHDSQGTELRITKWDEENPEWYTNEHWDYMNESIEKNIKLLVGDHVGQELFNDIRACADPYGSAIDYGPVFHYTFDADGIENLTSINGEFAKFIPNHADRFNASLFPMSKWTNRTTDYGKRFEVTFNSQDETGGYGLLMINVFNN